MRNNLKAFSLIEDPSPVILQMEEGLEKVNKQIFKYLYAEIENKFDSNHLVVLKENSPMLKLWTIF